MSHVSRLINRRGARVSRCGIRQEARRRLAQYVRLGFERLEDRSLLAVDLSVDVTDSPDPVTAGSETGNLVYTVKVVNNGDTDATGVTLNISDSLPDGVSFVLASGDGSNTFDSGGPDTDIWSIGDLAIDATATLTVTYTVDATTADGATVSLTADGTTASETLVNTGDDAATEDTSVERQVDLQVAISDAPDPVTAGSGSNNLVYTVTVTNAGPSDSSNLALNLSNSLPSGVSFVSAGGDGSNDFDGSGTGVWNISELPLGATATLTVTYTVDATTADGATVSLTADGTTASETLVNTGDDAATEDTTVQRQIDLQVAISDAPDPVTAGSGSNNLVYTVTVTNAGPSDSSNLALNLSNSLPEGVSFVLASGDGSNTFDSGGPDTDIWSIGDLAIDATAMLTVTYTVDATTADGATVSLTADGTTANETLVNTGDDAATEDTSVERQVDLQVAISDSPDPVTAGSGANNLVYTVTVTNAGPSDSSNLALNLSNSLPSGVSFVSAGGDGSNDFDGSGTGVWNISELPLGATATLTVTYTVDATTADGATVSLTADGTTASETLVNTGDDAATEDTTVQRQVDLQVAISDAPDPVTAGSGSNNLVYTVTVTNAGPSDSSNLALNLSNSLPSGVSFVSAGGDGSNDFNGTGTGVWSISELPFGATATLIVTYTVDATTADGATVSLTADGTTANETLVNTSDDDATEETTVQRQVDLQVAISDSPDPVTAGSGSNNLVYTVTVTNAGPSNSTSIALDLSNSLPSGVSFVSAGGDGSNDFDGSGTGTWSAGDLAVGSTATLTVTFTVDASTSDGASVSLTADGMVANENLTTTGDDDATDDTTVQRQVDLQVAISDAPDPVTAGSGANNLVYTVTVTNAGPSDSTSIALNLSNSLPSGVSFVSATGDGSNDFNGSGTGTWSIGDLPCGASATLLVAYTVDATTADGATVSLTADGTTASETLVNTSDDDATEETTVQRQVDLQVAISDSPDPVTAGSGSNNLVYTVTVTNAGPSDSSGITLNLSNSLPSGVSFVSAGGDGSNDFDGSGTGTWAIGDLVVGASATLLVTYTVDATTADGATVSLTADGTTAGETLVNTGDDDATESTTVLRGEDLRVAISDLPDPVIAGSGVGNLVYTVTVFNAGPSNASGVTLNLSDSLPSGVSFVSAAGDGLNDFDGSGTDTWSIGDLPLGATATLTVTFTVDASTSDGASVSLTADGMVANENLTTTGDDDATDDTTVQRQVDLQVAISDLPDPVAAGSGSNNLVYTVTVTNAGPSDSSGITLNLSNSLPSGVSFVSAGGDGSNDFDGSGTGTWSIGDLPCGATATLTVTYTVDATTTDGATVSLTADGTTASETLVNTGDDAATEDTTVQRQVDLQVAISDSPDPVAAGSGSNNLVYTVTVTNAGPSNSTSIALDLSNSLPSGVSFVSAGGDGSNDFNGSGTGTWAIGDLVVGASATLLVTYTVDATTADGATVSLTADGTTAGETLVNTSDDAATEDTSMQRQVDLQVAISDSPDPVTAGSGSNNLVYTVTVTNAGPSDSSGITLNLSNSLPSGVSFVSAGGDGSNDFDGSGTGTWAIGDLVVGASATLLVTYTVDATTADGATVSLTADGTTAGETLVNTGDDDATESTTVLRGEDLRVAISDLPDPVIAGSGVGNLVYTVTVFNAGPSNASGVTLNLSDSLPSGVSFVSAAGDGLNDFDGSGTDTWSIGDLPLGATATLTVTFTVDASTSDGASVSLTADGMVANENLTTTGDDAATEDTTVQRQVDLQVAISDLPDPVTAGSGANNLVYTVTVTNAGPSDSTSIALNLSNSLPSGVSFVSAGGDGSNDFDGSGTGTWSIGDLPCGATATLTVTYTVDATTADGPTVSLTADGTTASETLVNAGDDAATEDTSVQRQVDLQVAISDSPDPVTAGSGSNNLVYTVTVTNAGPSDSTSIALNLSNSLPSGVSFVSAGGDGSNDFDGSGTGTWTIGDLVVGASATLLVTYTVDATTADNATVSLTADGTTAGETLVNTSDDAASEDTSVQRQVDLQVAISDSPDPVTAGSGANNLVYTVTVTNAGPSNSTSIALNLSNSLPSGASFVSAGGDGSNDFDGTGTGTWSIGDLPCGATATLTVTYTVDATTADGATVSLTADGTTAGETLVNTGDDDATESTTVLRGEDLRVAISDLPDPVIAGSGVGNLVYTVTVFNAGPSNASGVTLNLSDSLPSGVSFVSAAGDGLNDFDGSGTDTWNIGDLTVGATATLTVTYTVNATTANNVTVSLTADGMVANENLTTTSDDAETESTTVQTRADLSIIAAGAAAAIAGDAAGFDYTFTVTNNGPSDNTGGFTVTDLLPAGLTFQATGSTSGASVVGQTVTYTNSTGLVSGGTQDFTIHVLLASSAANGSLILDTATVATLGTADPTPANNTSNVVSTTVQTSADLEIAAAAPATTIAGDPAGFDYILTVTNHGPSDNTGGFTVTDVLPAGLTFQSTGSTSGASVIGQTVSYTNTAGLVSGGTQIFTIHVLLVSSAADGSTLLDAATVATLGTADPTPGNDASNTTSTAVQTRADLSASVAGPATAIAGDAAGFDYTLTVTNHGPSDNTGGFTVTDVLPAGLTFQATGSTSGASVIGQTVTYTNSTGLVSGGTQVFTIHVRLVSSAASGSTLLDSATVATTGTTDPTPVNDTSSVFSTTVQTRADLSIIATGAAAAIAGDAAGFDYTFTVTNNGPSDNTGGFTVTDLLPAGLTFQATGSTSGASVVGQTVTYTNSTGLVSGGTQDFTIHVLLASSAANGSPILDTATVATLGTADPTPANNTSNVVSTTVQTSADLEIAAAAPATTIAGDPAGFDYTLTVTNHGPSDNTGGFTVTDVLPAGLTFQSTGSTSGASVIGQNVTYTNTAGLVSGGTQVFTIHVLLVSSAADGSTLLDSATVATTGTTDPTPGNDASNTTSTAVQTRADLSASVAGPATAIAGDAAGFDYTLTVTNHGPSDNTGGFTVTDVLPAGLTFQATGSTSGASVIGQTVTYTNSTGLVSGGTQVFTIHVLLVSSAANGSTFLDSATVATTGTIDPTPANDTSSVFSTTVQTRADLSIIAAGPTTAIAGDAAGFDYTFTVTNNGPSDNTGGFTVTDLLPAGLTFQATGSTSGASVVGQTVTYTNSTGLVSGGTQDFTIHVLLASSAANGSLILDSATVATLGTADPTPANNASNVVSTAVQTIADLAIAAAAPATTIAGDPAGFDYTLTVTNHGPSDNTGGFTVTDVLPAGLTFQSTGSTSGASVIGQNVKYTNTAGLVSGGTQIFTIHVRLVSSAADGSTLLDAATVATLGTADPTPANNTSNTTSTSVARQVDLVVSQTKSIDPIVAGTGTTNLTFVVTVANLGPSNATGLTLSELITLPTGVSLLSISPAVGIYAPSDSVDGVWTLGNLASGAGTTLTIVVAAGPAAIHGTTISSLATVTGLNEPRLNTLDDSSTISTSVLATDFGDAPSPFPTLLATNGARHLAVGATFGATRDAESDGQPNATAAGDGDDEDGFISQSFLAPGGIGSVVMNVQSVVGIYFINAWIDFNGDGDWADAGEQIATDVAVTSGGDKTLSFVAPLAAVAGTSLARFRLSTASGLSFTGAAPDGEVEDHLVTISPRPTAVIGGLGNVGEGLSVTLGGNTSTDPNGVPLTLFQWDLNFTGIFNPTVTGPLVNFSAVGIDGPATRTVALRVVNAFGSPSLIATRVITIDNRDPTINTFSAPGVGRKDKPVVLSAAASDPAGLADPLTFTWTITRPNATAFTLAGANPTFSPDAIGTFGVSLAVTDGDGGLATRNATIDVSPGAGNVTTQLFVDNLKKPQDRRLVITGDSEFNQLVIDLGVNGVKNSLRISGADGTKINGQDGPLEFSGIAKGLTIQLQGGKDVITVHGANVAGPITLDGGDGDDRYIVATSKTKLVLNDSSGTDTLDFSNWLAPAKGSKGVSVNLAKQTGQTQSLGNGNTLKLTGQIENIAGSPFDDKLTGNTADNIIHGGAGNDTILGGGGHNVLLGEAGNDKLTGSPAAKKLSPITNFDILIGGADVDKLTAGKNGNTILIGGTTTYDSDDAALLAILAEWSSGAPLANRIANLQAGVGPGNSIKLTSPGAVADDGLLETLAGAGGNNWFFKQGDKIKEKIPLGTVQP